MDKLVSDYVSFAREYNSRAIFYGQIGALAAAAGARRNCRIYMQLARDAARGGTQNVQQP